MKSFEPYVYHTISLDYILFSDVAELNKVACEDIFSNNFDRILYDSYANYGSKLWIGNNKDGHYQIRRGIPRSIKFRSITNLYKVIPINLMSILFC